MPLKRSGAEPGRSFFLVVSRITDVMLSENSCRQSGRAAAPGRTTSASLLVKGDDSSATCRQNYHTTRFFVFFFFFFVLCDVVLPSIGKKEQSHLCSFYSKFNLFHFVKE